ncbi:MAG: exonuclease domain-containing protein [bacterium]
MRPVFNLGNLIFDYFVKFIYYICTMKLDSEIYKQLSLTNFVVFDLETTGLSSNEDEIIEIGMIKIKEGKVTETYNQLFDPGIPIPENITRLTGITPTDCSGQPFLKDRISDIMDFMDSDFVVAHNADFDVSFLNAALIKYAFPQKKIYPEKIIDTLDLSRFLLYHLHNHTLRSLSDHFVLEGNPSHRALDDAKACGLIFIRLVELCLVLWLILFRDKVKTILLAN